MMQAKLVAIGAELELLGSPETVKTGILVAALRYVSGEGFQHRTHFLFW